MLFHSPYQMAVLGKSFVHFSPWPQLRLHSGSGGLWGVPAGSWFQVLGGKRDGDWRGRGQSCLKLVCRDFLGGNEMSPRRLWCRVAGGPARGYWHWNPASCSPWSSPFRSLRFILAPLPVVPILCDNCMLFIFCLLAVAPTYLSGFFFFPLSHLICLPVGPQFSEVLLLQRSWACCSHLCVWVLLQHCSSHGRNRFPRVPFSSWSVICQCRMHFLCPYSPRLTGMGGPFQAWAPLTDLSVDGGSVDGLPKSIHKMNGLCKNIRALMDECKLRSVRGLSDLSVVAV